MDVRKRDVTMKYYEKPISRITIGLLAVSLCAGALSTNSVVKANSMTPIYTKSTTKDLGFETRTVTRTITIIMPEINGKKGETKVITQTVTFKRSKTGICLEPVKDDSNNSSDKTPQLPPDNPRGVSGRGRGGAKVDRDRGGAEVNGSRSRDDSNSSSDKTPQLPPDNPRGVSGRGRGGAKVDRDRGGAEVNGSRSSNVSTRRFRARMTVFSATPAATNETSDASSNWGEGICYINYGDWQVESGDPNFIAVEAPKIDNFTPSQAAVAEKTVTPDSENETVTITYTATPKTETTTPTMPPTDQGTPKTITEVPTSSVVNDVPTSTEQITTESNEISTVVANNATEEIHKIVNSEDDSSTEVAHSKINTSKTVNSNTNWQSSEETEPATLPQTGEKNNSMLGAIGTLLAGLASLLVFHKKEQ